MLKGKYNKIIFSSCVNTFTLERIFMVCLNSSSYGDKSINNIY